MKQKLPFLLMLGLAFLSSCASYQISTIIAQSENQSNQDPFTFENDTVKIVYNFKGYNAPLTISIQNKLNLPLYIDWNKSMIVFDNNSISLSGADIQIKGKIIGSVENYGTITSYTYQDANLSASKPLNTDYLLPKATIKRKTIYVANEMIRNVSDKSLGYSYINSPDGSGSTKVPTATFNQENSPLRFKAYITLYTVNDDAQMKKSMTFNKSFYVSDIKTVNTKPNAITYYSEADKNVFYTGKITSFGRGMEYSDASLTRGMNQPSGNSQGLKSENNNK